MKLDESELELAAVASMAILIVFVLVCSVILYEKTESVRLAAIPFVVMLFTWGRMIILHVLSD